MLNPSFSKSVEDKFKSDIERYVLPPALTKLVLSENTDQAGVEYRLQEEFTDEIWLKIKSLKLERVDWNKARVLDVACGGGFLTYHLLQKVHPKELVLADISPAEVASAQQFLTNKFPNVNMKFEVKDVLQSGFPDESFDIIIGNSFIHHFYDLPHALNEFRRMLKPGGVFITLHEPTTAAPAFEYKNILLTGAYILMGKRYVDLIRHKGEGVAPGGGADVWIFEKKSLVSLFVDARYSSVRADNWNLFRPMVVALFSLHLSDKKKSLNTFERLLFKSAILTDNLLHRILPASFFGSVCLVARKQS